MNSRNSKTSDPHRLLLNHADEIYLKIKVKYIILSNLSIYYIWGNIKMPYKNNKLKILAPTWNEKLKLLDETYFISYIQYYFEYIPEKQGEKTINPSIRIYKKKIENRITFRIKTGYYLEFLNLETMKLLESAKINIIKYENSENVPYLEITEFELIHCNVVSHSHQQNLRALYTFVPNKTFGQLLDIPSNKIIFLKAFDSEFSYTEVWFTDQNSKPWERR